MTNGRVKIYVSAVSDRVITNFLNGYLHDKNNKFTQCRLRSSTA